MQVRDSENLESASRMIQNLNKSGKTRQKRNLTLLIINPLILLMNNAVEAR